MNKMTRALSETDLRELSVPKKKPFNQLLGGLSVEDEEESKAEKGFSDYSRTASFGCGLFSFSELEEECEVGLKDDAMVGLLVGGAIGAGGGRSSGGGGGSDAGGDERSGFWDSNHGNDGVDMYYQTMIEANPGNPLLLSNYAKYLKEVCDIFIGSAFFSYGLFLDLIGLPGDLKKREGITSSSVFHP